MKLYKENLSRRIDSFVSTLKAKQIVLMNKESQLSKKIDSIKHDCDVEISKLNKGAKKLYAKKYKETNNRLTKLTVDIYDVCFRYKNNDASLFSQLSRLVGEVKKTEAHTKPKTSKNPLHDISERKKALKIIMLNRSGEIVVTADKLLTELNKIEQQFKNMDHIIKKALKNGISKTKGELKSEINKIELDLKTLEDFKNKIEETSKSLYRCSSIAETLLDKYNEKIKKGCAADEISYLTSMINGDAINKANGSLDATSVPPEKEIEAIIKKAFNSSRTTQTNRFLRGLDPKDDVKSIKSLSKEVTEILDSFPKSTKIVEGKKDNFKKSLINQDKQMESRIETNNRNIVEKRIHGPLKKKITKTTKEIVSVYTTGRERSDAFTTRKTPRSSRKD